MPDEKNKDSEEDEDDEEDDDDEDEGGSGKRGKYGTFVTIFFNSLISDSIVIGFWVGLAVFVIFMFFVLTLLTKTGAPHPDSGEPCEKRPHLASCVDALNLHTNPGTAPSLHPRALRSSCSLFQCDVAEDEPGSSRAQSAREGGSWAGGRGRSGQGRAHRRPSSPGEKEEEDNVVIKEEPAVMEKESVLLAHFNIPNFVNSEHSLTLGEEDLQLGESAASHPGGAGPEWH